MFSKPVMTGVLALVFTVNFAWSQSSEGVRVSPVKSAITTFEDLPQVSDEAKSDGFSVPLRAPAPNLPGPSDLPVPDGFRPLPNLPRIDFAAPDGFSVLSAESAKTAPLSDGFLALKDSGQVIPPDTMGAVGPKHLIVTLNDRIRIQTKAGAEIYTASLSSFWEPLGVSDVFDPKVVFDSLSQRFVFISCAEALSPASSMLLAVSATSDPTKGWYQYQFDGDFSNNLWVDYPNIGVNNKWITFTANMFGITDGFQGDNIWVVNKSSVLNGGEAQASLFYRTDVGFTLVPCLTFSATEPTQYLVNTWSSFVGLLRLYTITGTASSPVFTATNFYPQGPAWSDDFQYYDAPQRGSLEFSGYIYFGEVDAGDDRMMNAVFRDGSLWCVHTAGTPLFFDDEFFEYLWPRTYPQWYQINPATGVSVQVGTIQDPANRRSYYYPSLTVNSANEMLVGFSGSSFTEWIGAYYTRRISTAAPGATESVSLMKEGEEEYYKTFGTGRNRWGDYSATSVDPSDDATMWTIQEYAAFPLDTWSTWWGKFTGGRPITDFRATPTGSSNRVILTWENPEDSVIQQIKVLRKQGAFPANQGGAGETLVFQGTTSNPVQDIPPTAGEYFYGVFVNFGSGAFTEKAFARAIAGQNVPLALSEPYFPALGSIDLAFSQLTFSPVVDIPAQQASGNPTAYTNYSNYTVSRTSNVTTFPEAREGTITPLFIFEDEGYVDVPLEIPFPYFGNEIGVLRVWANGFITPAVTGDDIEIFPSYDGHFSVPRISFLFGDLTPNAGGEVWLKYGLDKVTVTFDRVPEYGTTDINAVQAELFRGGQIRFTYLDLNIREAIVGLSDGKGVPIDPNLAEFSVTDLSTLGAADKLILDPIDNQYGTEGEPLQFEVTTQSPGGVPVLTASALPDQAEFTSSNGKGVFKWTNPEPGTYAIVVCAALGSDKACQETPIFIESVDDPPVVLSASITPPDPGTDDSLTAVFPRSANVDYAVYWYRNGALLSGSTNQPSIPAAATEEGDTFFFTVTPRAGSLVGEAVISNVVTISSKKRADVNKDGSINSIDVQLTINAALDLAKGSVHAPDVDINRDGRVDSIDIQLVINGALGK